jgi:hypothetical protein
MKELLVHNLGWKLLSLGIALILWFTIIGEQELTGSVSAAVVFRNIPQDLEIASEFPDRVHLELQGPVGQLSALANPAVILNLGSVDTKGERTFTIRQTEVNLPPGVRMLRAVPSQIRLQFERRLSRSVPVHLRFGGPPPAGYRVAHQTVRPAQVTIVGPESRVRQVEQAETDPIEISAVVGQKEFRVPVYVADQHVRIEGDPFVIAQITMERMR